MSEPIKLLLDEHIWYGLMDALVQRGYDVVHVISLEQRGLDDEPLLDLAASLERAILTNKIHADACKSLRVELVDNLSGWKTKAF